MILADGGCPSLAAVLATLVGGTLAAGAANALNCYLDRDIDAVMRRTQRRPLPATRSAPRGAGVRPRAGGLVVGLMAATTTLLAAALTAVAIVYYVLVYTLGLKRRTRRRTSVGGVPGRAGADRLGGGDRLAGLAAPVVLFGVVFFWQPPHFWALAMRFKEDYARAGVPMLPVVATPAAVARRIIGYTWLTVAASLLLWPSAGDGSWIYGAVAVLSRAWFVVPAHQLLGRIRREADDQADAAVPPVDHLPRSLFFGVRRRRRPVRTIWPGRSSGGQPTSCWVACVRLLRDSELQRSPEGWLRRGETRLLGRDRRRGAARAPRERVVRTTRTAAMTDEARAGEVRPEPAPPGRSVKYCTKPTTPWRARRPAIDAARGTRPGAATARSPTTPPRTARPAGTRRRRAAATPRGQPVRPAVVSRSAARCR